ncbi:diguanylate cyclase [Selenomonas sp. AB3002]|uniref:sensor domain-containing diguanylate cyclase n=1 Tax=Selenomonas sp. AB3002 TaxID=1392502 RepID=UPI0004965572
MIQRKYTFHSFDEMEKIISAITASEYYTKASGVLLQLYNPKININDTQIVERISSKCSKACLVGITCANIADERFDIKDRPVELNATFFRTTRLLALDFDMDTETGFDAGRLAHHQLQGIPDARCILICYSCGCTAITAFINEISHHDLPIFGAKAGRSIRALNTALVYGRKARANGIVAVIFAGDDLRLYMDNCLGFKEIGLQMVVTKTEGDHIISEIDHKPATEVYSKYLNVTPNSYFVHNVCEFPLIFHRKNCSLARVPSNFGEDGSIHFTADVVKGETFRLSYGNPNNLMQIIDQSVNGLKRFHPEAVFLFECGNRIRFLKDQASRETDSFRENSPELSVAIGYAELFYSPDGGGGSLTSALVAVGLAENPSTKDEFHICIDFVGKDSPPEEEEREYIPFVDRILHFLETTSIELDQRNRELGRIAYTDRLTRIYNRWELENKITDILKLHEDDLAPVSLIFMDIDHFKLVNDTYGHDVGDMVLRETVDLIRDNLQPQHVFGRWGGEEFLYALPDTSLEEAKSFAENLRMQVEKNCYRVVKHVTMSFGVTSVAKDDDMDSLVKRADKALYMAKEGGRNQVIGI